MRYAVYMILAILQSLIFLGSARSQSSPLVGNCLRPETKAYLGVGNVRARVYNDGSLFGAGGLGIYEVPKGSGVNAIFKSGLLLAGYVNGEIRSAGRIWGSGGFWPGPLDIDAAPPSDCAEYDQIFSLRKADIDNLTRFGALSSDVNVWPWRLGAPILDGDGIEENFDPHAGDLPAILGDHMLWWIMNDRGNENTYFNSPPIGLEIKASAFSFEPLNGAIENATFYRYQIRNRNDSTLDSAYVGLFIDVDLGDYSDDYIGSDSTLGLGFFYNADNIDSEYGMNPPAIGFSVIKGPKRQVSSTGSCSERSGVELGVTGHQFFFGDPPHPWGQPQTARHLHNYLSGRLLDGRPLREGANMDIPRNYGDGPIMKFMMTGDPVTSQFWSEMNVDGNGTAAQSGDRRSFLGSGPFCLDPGEETDVVFAIVWSRSSDHLESVRQLKRDVAGIQSISDFILTPYVAEETTPSDSYELSVQSNFPNPFSESTTVRYTVPNPTHVRLVIFNSVGQKVATLVDDFQEAGVYSADFVGVSLPSGIYYGRLDIGRASTTGTLVLVR